MASDVRELNTSSAPDLMIVSPDVGGVVRARALAKSPGYADLAIVDKRRSGPRRERGDEHHRRRGGSALHPL